VKLVDRAGLPGSQCPVLEGLIIVHATRLAGGRSAGGMRTLRLPATPIRRLALTTSLACLLVGTSTATAQVAPVGAHDTTVGPGAGLEPVASPTGAFSTAVPLSLPPSRSGIPVPVQITYQGTTRAGAAGSGWDVPLSFVRVSSSTMRRKPSLENSGSVADAAATRVFVALDGAPMLMVRSKTPGTYVPFASDAYMELTQFGTQWRLEVMGGRRYWFSSAYELSGHSFHDASLWLLTKVEDVAAKDRLDLTYNIAPTAAIPGCAQIELETVRHTYDSAKNALFEIKLEYEERGLIARDLDEGFCTARTRIIKSVIVSARDNTAATATALHQVQIYTLDYETVASTGLPRLISVSLRGEGDNAAVLPLARYAYAPESTQWGDPAVVKRSFTAPGGGNEAGRYSGSISTTERSVEHLEQREGTGLHERWVRADVEHTYTRSVLRDFTGDGQPDLVFKSGSTWVLYPNVTTDQGTQFGSAYTWNEPAEIFEQSTTRVHTSGASSVHDHTSDVDMRPAERLARDAMVTTETWVQFLDWNGDGRMDIVDARHGDEKYYWKVWINEGLSNGHVTWRSENVFVDELRFAGDDPDHAFMDLQDELDGITAVAEVDPISLSAHARFPLERSRSWPWMHWVTRSCYTPEMASVACVYTSPDGQQGPYPDVGAWTWQTDTLTEWRLEDVNGDRYPDFVKNRRASSRCALDTRSVTSLDEEYEVDDCPNMTFTACMERGEHWEYATGGACPNTDPYDRTQQLEHDVYLNVGGAMFPTYAHEGDLFRWSEQRAGAVDEWANGEMFTVQVDPESSWPVETSLPSGESPSRQIRAYVDLDGDAIPELHDFGGGSGSAWERAARFATNRDEVCDGWGTDNHEFYSRQIEGLVDLNGDGIPDRVWLEHGESWTDPELDPGTDPQPPADWFEWHVQYGNGVGYGERRGLPDDFELSRSRGTCSTIAQTVAGIEDLDGDGKPEMLRVENGDLQVRRLLPLGMTDLADAGRLITIFNGKGARTRIAYGNNKTETQTAHQVPFPEIVVRETWTEHPDGTLAINPTRYAYGNARLTYDAVLARWSFAGYQRGVAVTGDPKASEVYGVAVITDRSPAAPPGATHADRLKAGRVVQTTRLEGALPSNARLLLTTDVNTTTKARAGSRIDYDVIPIDSDMAPAEECFDADGATGAFPIGDLMLCQRAGVVVAWNTTQWEGTAAPPSTANVWGGQYVETYDPLARPTKVVDLGDIRQSDDDTCTQIAYAQPTTDDARLRSRPSAVYVTDCGLGSTASASGTLILAGTRFTYDGLPEGQVGDGRPTATIVERYDGAGTLLGQFVAQQTEYEPELAVPKRILQPRSIGTSTLKTTELEFDRYGATLKTSKSSATDVGVQLVQAISAPIWPSKEITVTAATGEQSATIRDSFGRVKETRLAAAGSSTFYIVSHTDYDDTSAPRVVTTRQYYGDTPAGSTSTNRSTLGRSYIDALGRTIYSTVELGGDYGGKVLVTGFTLFDLWGRPRYEAAPFDAPATFTPPTESQLPYGTTYAYDAGSRLLRSVDGLGYQPTALTTNSAADIYPTSYEYLWANGRAVRRVRGPTELEPGGPTYGYYDQSEEAGAYSSRSRWSNATTRVDRVDTFLDRLGRLKSTRRFKDPQVGTGIVEWSSKYDSLGNVLEQNEPGTSPVKVTYDEWGAPISSEWVEGNMRRVTKWVYDGFGRVTDRVLTKIKIGQTSGTDESVEYYYYDEPSGDSSQPVVGSYVGRLSWAEAKGVSASFYTYDNFGRAAISTAVHTDEASQRYRTQTKYSATGNVDGLVFEFPGPTGVMAKEEISYELDSAGRTKRVKYFDGASTMTLLDATTIDPLGRYRALTLGNNVVESFEYQPTGRQELSYWLVHTAQDTRWTQYDQFDPEMRVTRVGEQVTGATSSTTKWMTHTYDGLDRLRTAATEFNGTTQSLIRYEYDSLGNLRTRRNDLIPSTNADLSYTGTDPDRLTQSITFGSWSSLTWQYAYNGAGNVTSETPSGSTTATSKSFTYDSSSRVRNMHSGTLDANFKYGPAGELAVEEVLSGSTLNRRVRHYGDLIEKRSRPGSNTVERYVPGPLGVLASIRGTGSNRSIVYTHGDGRGNRFFTDGTGAVVQSADYDPYGTVLTQAGSPTSQNYSDDLFNGGSLYAEFGTVLLGARVYEPSTGRFLQRDPIAFVPQSTKGNPYTFSWADPINYADPSGAIAVHIGTSFDPSTNTSTPTFSYATGNFNGDLMLANALNVLMQLDDLGTGIDRVGVDVVNDHNFIYTDSAWGRSYYVQYTYGAPAARTDGKWTSMTRTAWTRALIVNEDLEAASPAQRQALEDAMGALKTIETAAYWMEKATPGLRESLSVAETISYGADPLERGAPRMGGPPGPKGGGRGGRGRAGERARLCFAAGTLVRSADGLVPIEEIEVGDYVWSRDDKTGEEGWRAVTELFETPEQEVLELQLRDDDGITEILRVTPGHPIWSDDDDAWDSAGHLALGEHVHTLRGPMTLTEVTKEPQRETVYNFDVEELHTYFVGEAGVWAHNWCPGASLRGKSLKAIERAKPKGWRKVKADDGSGWKWVDQNNTERLRFMRPNGKNPMASKWSRQSNGYFRWKNERNQYLDVDGNVVDPNAVDYPERTHIMYEGP
jgi:RHS repeat-associated protein